MNTTESSVEVVIAINLGVKRDIYRIIFKLIKMKNKLYKAKQKFKKYIKGGKKHHHYESSNEFWVQKMPYKNIEVRLDFFISECKNKDVLHFGCTDWPVFNSNNNLHIQLSEHTKSIDGFDIDEEGIENLRKFVNQDYFSKYNDIPDKKYDVCLVPETIEHVDNVEIFLKNVSRVNASKFFITGPNCFSKERLNNFIIEKDHFIEIVHPDHNCWYSPYTLKNQIEKYSSLKVTNIYLLENGGMICCEAVKK